jgi:acetolactate synthase-1/2/3 large subunit
MKRNGAQLLVAYLEQEGVRVVFGVPGGHLLAFYDALIDSSIAPVLAKHESGAAFMAGGYAQVSGGLGVCCGTVGPGATNLVTGVAAAYMQSIPMLVMTAQVGTSAIGQGALQEAAGLGRTFSQTALFSCITKHSEMVTRADRLGQAIRRALSIAWSGRPGPVHLDLPADVFKAELQEDIVARDRYRPAALSHPPQAHVSRAVRALADAKRPAILAGAGATRGTGPATVLALAEKLELPVATTMQAKGIIPEDHPLALGCFGLYGTRAANRYMRSGLDVLLVVGSSLHEWTTHVWDPTLQPSGTLIQVEIDPEEIGKNYPVDIALHGDAAIVLADLLQAAGAEPESPDRAQLMLDPLRADTEYFSEAAMTSDAVPIKPQRAMAEVRRALPDDAIVFTDIGNSVTWVERCYVARKPNTVVGFGNLAAMGSGVAAVVGGKLAAGSRPAVAICGDGDFQMHGMEVMTAVSHEIPAIWIVLENGGLAMIRDTQTSTYRGRHISCDFQVPDLPLLAQSFGALGLRASEPGEIAPMLAEALSSGRPAILSIAVDPDEMPPAKARMLAMQRSMGLPDTNRSISLGAIKALLTMFRER